MYFPVECTSRGPNIKLEFLASSYIELKIRTSVLTEVRTLQNSASIHQTSRDLKIGTDSRYRLISISYIVVRGEDPVRYFLHVGPTVFCRKIPLIPLVLTSYSKISPNSPTRVYPNRSKSTWNFEILE